MNKNSAVEVFPMPAMDRLLSEQCFHDEQARHRRLTFHLHPRRYCLDDGSYLDHETWIRPAIDQLGDVRGARVLDLGCGHGMAAVVLARRGAYVTALDLSLAYLTEARQRAAVNNASVRFVQADGARLPFKDTSFDCIWGNAILHHLDLIAAGHELHRVLHPKGIAVFCEPWGENPFLRWVRHRIHYPGKGHTPDEQPLRQGDVQTLRRIFPSVQTRGYQLFSMVRRLLGPGRLVTTLSCVDELILSVLPPLQRFSRYIVLTLRR